MFCWSKIISRFETQFYEAFSTNKKAHFDNVPDEYKVVDGARVKWCNLLLLDGIIYLLRNDSLSASTRRAFNQYRVLYEAIFDELNTIDPVAYSEITEDKTTDMAIKAAKFSYLHVGQLEHPWDSMENLFIALIDTPPSKAKNKYITMVQLLTLHENIVPFAENLLSLVQVVICRVLFIIQNPKIVTAAELKPPVIHQIESISFDMRDVVNENTCLTPGNQSTSNVISNSVKKEECTSPRSVNLNVSLPVPQSPAVSPATKHKRVASNSCAKKRPSFEQRNVTSKSKNENGLTSTDSWNEKLLKLFNYSPYGTMLFGESSSSSSQSPSSHQQQQHQQQRQQQHFNSFNTNNMTANQGFRSPSATTLAPIFVPQQSCGYEKYQQQEQHGHDFMDQQRTGMTPTVAGLSLNQSQSSSPRVFSPLSPTFYEQSAFRNVGTSQPMPVFFNSASTAAAGATSSSQTNNCFLTDDECSLLMEFSHDNSQQTGDCTSAEILNSSSNGASQYSCTPLNLADVSFDFSSNDEHQHVVVPSHPCYPDDQDMSRSASVEGQQCQKEDVAATTKEGTMKSRSLFAHLMDSNFDLPTSVYGHLHVSAGKDVPPKLFSEKYTDGTRTVSTSSTSSPQYLKRSQIAQEKELRKASPMSEGGTTTCETSQRGSEEGFTSFGNSSEFV